MLRHPIVIAAFILSGGMLLSALLIFMSISSLSTSLDRKPVMTTGSNISFPDHISLSNGNSYFDVRVRTAGEPLQVKQVP